MLDSATTMKYVQSSPKNRPHPPHVPESKAELERVYLFIGEQEQRQN